MALAAVNLKKMVSSLFIIFIFELMDMLSYSGSIMVNKNYDKDIENICMVLYIYPTIISIFCFNLFSSIKYGIVSAVIVENFKFFSKISEIMYENTTNKKTVVTNFCTVIFIANLMYSFISIAMMKYNVGRFISQIPKTVVIGILTFIGLIQIPIGLKEIMPDGWHTAHVPIYTAAFVGMLLIFLLQKKYPARVYILPASMFVILLLFYTVSLFIFHGNLFDKLIDHGWLHQKNTQIINPYILFRMLDPQTVSIKLIFYSLRHMFTVVFFSLLHCTYSLPYYKIGANINLDYSSEIGAQGFANLFTFVPCYFVPCYAIPFYKCGGDSKIYGFIGGFPLLFVAFFGLIIRGYIPRSILCIPPLLIGLTMFLDAAIPVIREITLFEQLSVLIIALVSFLTDDCLSGVLIGTIIHSMFYLYMKDKCLGHKYDLSCYETRPDITYIKIDYVLCFITQHRFKYNCTGNKMIIDLLECPAVDWIGSDLLYNTIKNANHPVIIVGSPCLLNLKRFRSICTVADTDDEICKIAMFE